MELSRPHRVAAVVVVAAILATGLGFSLYLLLPPREPPARLTVVASIFPLWEFARWLVGPDVRVVALVPPGIEPHDWEPTTKDLRSLAEADLLVYIHPDFETYVPTLLSSIASPPPAIATAEGLELLHLGGGGQGPIDPHIWLDPLLAMHQVRIIRDALIQVDPTFADEYRQRAEVLLQELEFLHAEMAAGLAACGLRTFIASHAAFSYFARRYNLTLEPITPDPEVEPSPARIQELISFAREHNITVIYSEPVVGTGAAGAIAEEIGGTTLVLDPVEGLSGDSERTYFSIMRDNLANLRQGLRC